MAQRARRRGRPFERDLRESPRFPRLPRILHAVFVYAVLILASLFILLPIGWMLTAALKPDTAPVFTFPPEWFPTRVLALADVPGRPSSRRSSSATRPTAPSWWS